MERFCDYVDANASVGADELSADIVIGFISSCSIYTKSTVSCTVSCLRGYLTYLHEQGLTQANLSVFVPHVSRMRDSEIPSAYAAEDVEKLLSVIERNDPKGKRDYAMILIAARLGLRSSDICGLTFNSIDWERNKISLVQQKTDGHASYPLLEDVGVAIIDYLKYGRKNVIDKTHVFLSEHPPYTRLSGKSLHFIVDHYMKRAGIHVPVGKKHGPHALRHSLGSRLLENDIPLPIISDILAHKSAETTKIYLKIAEKQLSACSLDVPALQGEG
jgi:site-specific recombinase XerD